MKIIVNDVKQFAKAVNTVAKAAEKREVMPVLNHILLNVEENRTTLMATDFQVALQEDVTKLVKVKKTGAVCLPAKALKDFLKGASGTMQITLEKDNWTTLGDMRIAGISWEEFPVISKNIGRVFNSFTIQNLRDHLMEVTYAVGEKDTRYMLNTVYFDLNTRNLVATDGNRLALSSFSKDFTGRIRPLPPKKWGERHNPTPNGAVPLRAALLLQALPGTVSVECGREWWQFTSGGITLYTPLIEGVYPNYQAVIPRIFDKSLTVDREQFISKIKTAKATAKNGGVRLSVPKTLPKKLRISASNPDTGGYDTEIACRTRGDEMKLDLNAGYLLDILRTISRDTVTLLFNDSLTPVMVKENWHEALVMPMRM